MTLEGIHLKSENKEELHKMAHKYGISKSWLHTHPEVYYDIICPFKLRLIAQHLKNKRNDRK